MVAETSSATTFPTPQYNENQQQLDTIQNDFFDVLSNLHDTLDGENWKNFDNWMSSENVCSWKGVTCEGDTITRLELPSNNMKGKFHIVKLLKELPGLKKLNIRNNDLEIIIWPENEEYIKNSNLEILNLNNIDLQETFESLFEYVNFPELRELYMSTCNIDYPEFPFFDRIILPKIQKLDFHDNMFHSIPEDFQNMDHLEDLSLERNLIIQKIPKNFGHHIRNLKVLNLSHNSLYGEIPESISSHRFLEIVDLSGQLTDNDCDKGHGLTGPLPDFADKPKLFYLDLSHNCLNGTITWDFLDLPLTANAFKFLGLENNKLSGEITYNPVFVGLDDDKIDFADNEFTSIDSKNCDNREYGCASLVCPVGTYNEIGHQDESHECLPCPTNLFLGSTICSVSSSTTPSPTVASSQAKEVAALPSPGDNHDQHDVLSELYNTLDGEKWRHQDSWLEIGDVCLWEGITCENDFVTRIDLASNNMEGDFHIVKLLRQLPTLKYLDLENNDLRVIIWSQDDPFTSYLEELNVNRVDFEDTFQKFFEYVTFPELRELYMVSCSIDSEFPFFDDFILPKIEKLDLDDNDFDNIPWRIQYLESLNFLSLNDNVLDGEIPKEFGSRLPNLKYLSMARNYFEGAIPNSFSLELKSLEILDLSEQLIDNDCNKGAGFVGALPSFKFSLNLRRIDLSSNCLTGEIPEDFLDEVDIEEFEYVGLGNNKLTGNIPAIPSFVVLDDDDLTLYDNQFTSIDNSVCADRDYECASLACPVGMYSEDGYQDDDEPCLSCPTNQFLGSTRCYAAGELPGDPHPTISLEPTPAPPVKLSEEEILTLFFISLGGSNWENNDNWKKNSNYCTWYGVECNDEGSVESIILLGNTLRGELPTEIYLLPNLSVFTISNNPGVEVTFTGIKYAENLRSLDVSATGLSDVEDLDDAPRLTELNLEDNNLKGDIPWQIFELEYLEQLRLGDNQLTEELDGEDLRQLEQLKIFTADGNQIRGSLPKGLVDCGVLHTLRLNGNKLNGTLPEFLQDMTSLSFVDLSNNHIGGKLLPFDNHRELRRLDLSFNNVSGTIPSTFLSKVDKYIFENVSIRRNLITGSIPSILAGMAFGFQDNQITSIDSAVYDSSNGGAVADFGSDAILCPPQTWNSLGRQEGLETPCLECPSIEYYGSTFCGDMEVSSSEATQPMEAPLNTVSTSVPNNQFKVLYDFHLTLHGDKWVNSHNWMLGKRVCSWFGITCEDEIITGIDISSNNAEGKLDIVKLLKDLPGLKNLVLGSNNINPIISPETGDKALVSNLQELNLNIIDFEETFDSFFEYVSFPELRELSMVSCHIDSDFPFFSSPVLLPKIEKLILDDNDFDYIPWEFEKIESLEFLSLKYNMIGNNKLPFEMGSKLPNLKFLYLTGNYIKGDIPGTLMKLEHLEVVDISEQLMNVDDDCSNGYGLTGPLPSFSSSHNLRRLYLNSNCLTGTIPNDFLQGTDTETFEAIGLENNRLTGDIPSIAAFINLDDDDITLYDNRFTSIDESNCEDRDYGCASLVCPVGTYNEDGYQDDDEPCLSCPTNQFLGSTQCYGVGQLPSNAPPTISLAPTPVPPKQMSEEEILKLFYDSLGGSEWTNNDNWESSDNHCTWYGVECNDEGSVESLIIIGNNMKGQLATEVYLLPNLNTLTISDNWYVDIIFTGIEYADNLRSLDVSGTALSDVEDLDDAPELTELNLANNTLQGEIPWQIFELDTLEALRLEYNNLSDEIDGDDINQLENLKIFTAGENRITGTIPEGLADCQLLHTLRLQGNQLSGRLPLFFQEMTDLTFLDLSHNRLNGPLIPFDNHEDLRMLDLSYNGISGTIPVTFLAKVDRKTFGHAAVRYNSITGTIPLTLAGLEVEFQGNQISAIDPAVYDPNLGTIAQFGSDSILCPPKTWNSAGKRVSNDTPCEECQSAQWYGSTSCIDEHDPTLPPASLPIQKLISPINREPVLTDEEILTKLYNYCGGSKWYRHQNWTKVPSICDWEGIECAKGTEFVESISLASNNINGEPPSDIFMLPHLSKLILYNNPLGDFDFSHISQATNLTTLLLDATGLTSIAGVEKAPKLKKLNLRYNSLEGELPVELKELTSLKFLSLSNNMYEGPLPDIFEQMPNLETLLLESNRFSGELSTFKLPPKLRLVDLSDNQFSGPIEPSFLSNFPSKEHIEIDLSDNALEGVVPETFARFERINFLLKGNFIQGVSPELCVKKLWNDGDVGAFGCDGILCPQKTWAQFGRSTKANLCEPCDSANFFGDAICQSLTASKSTTSIATQQDFSMLTLIFPMIIIAVLPWFRIF